MLMALALEQMGCTQSTNRLEDREKVATRRDKRLIDELGSLSSSNKFSLYMNSVKLVIPLQSLYWSIHTKDESKRGTAFAFIFGVN